MVRESSRKRMRWLLEGMAVLAIVIGSVIGSVHSASSEQEAAGEEGLNLEPTDLCEASPLNTDVLLNAKGSRVFKFTLEDFRKSFNDYYSRDYHKQLLIPQSEWSQKINKQTDTYTFKEEQENWRLPTLSIDVDQETKKVERVMVSFDDHSYSEESYGIYERYCFYAVRCLLPDAEDEQIKRAYETLNDRAYKNISDIPFDRAVKPDCVYYSNNVAVYAYFAAGECLHLCMVPVDEQILDRWRGENVQVYLMNEKETSRK